MCVNFVDFHRLSVYITTVQFTANEPQPYINILDEVTLTLYIVYPLNNIEKRLDAVNERLDALYVQVENAKAELGKPFPQEEELKVKSARLAELNAELNIEDKTPMEQTVDNAAARHEEAPSERIAKSEKPSLLAKLQRPLPDNKAVEIKNNELEGR